MDNNIGPYPYAVKGEALLMLLREGVGTL